MRHKGIKIWKVVLIIEIVETIERMKKERLELESVIKEYDADIQKEKNDKQGILNNLNNLKEEYEKVKEELNNTIIKASSKDIKPLNNSNQVEDCNKQIQSLTQELNKTKEIIKQKDLLILNYEQKLQEDPLMDLLEDPTSIFIEDMRKLLGIEEDIEDPANKIYEVVKDLIEEYELLKEELKEEELNNKRLKSDIEVLNREVVDVKKGLSKLVNALKATMRISCIKDCEVVIPEIMVNDVIEYLYKYKDNLVGENSNEMKELKQILDNERKQHTEVLEQMKAMHKMEIEAISTSNKTIINQLEEKVKNLTEKLAKKKQKLVLLKKENNQLKQKSKEDSEKYENIVNNIEQVEEEKKHLEKQLNNLIFDKDKLLKELENTKSQLTANTLMLNLVKEEMEVKLQAAERGEKIAKQRLLQSYEENTERINELKEKLNNHKVKEKMLKDRNNELKTECKHLQSLCNEAKTDMQKMVSTTRKLTNSRTSLNELFAKTLSTKQAVNIIINY